MDNFAERARAFLDSRGFLSGGGETADEWNAQEISVLAALLASTAREAEGRERETLAARFHIVTSDVARVEHAIFLGDLCVDSDVGSLKDAEAVLAQFRKALLTGAAAIRATS